MYDSFKCEEKMRDSKGDVFIECTGQERFEVFWEQGIWGLGRGQIGK